MVGLQFYKKKKKKLVDYLRRTGQYIILFNIGHFDISFKSVLYEGEWTTKFRWAGLIL